MPIILDEHARELIARRQAHHRDSRIVLYVERLRGHAGAMAGNPEVLTVGWHSGGWPLTPFVARNAGDHTVFMDMRVARYTHWRDLTISGWHLGPLDHLTVGPGEILAMQDWEQVHPKDRQRPTLFRRSESARPDGE